MVEASKEMTKGDCGSIRQEVQLDIEPVLSCGRCLAIGGLIAGSAIIISITGRFAFVACTATALVLINLRILIPKKRDFVD